MKKIIKIEGMSCSHCVMRVQKKLNSLQGVSVDVSLEKGIATVSCDHDIKDNILVSAITDLGFDVLEINNA